MGFFDWLSSPHGIEVEHAVIVLLLAVAGYFSALAKRAATQNRELLNSHLEMHIMEEQQKNGPR